jgi:hypothetical protein
MAPGIVIESYVYHIRLHGGQMTKTIWFDDLELLARRSAWERGERILSQAQKERAPWSGVSVRSCGQDVGGEPSILAGLSVK